MLPRVVLFNAVSLDGRVIGFPVDVGRFYEIASSWREDATLAGSNTILQGHGVVEDGEPPVEDGERVERDGRGAGTPDPRPLLAIVDSRGRVRSWRQLLTFPYWRGGVALCSRATPAAHLAYLEGAGVDFIRAGDDRVDLRAALEELRERYGVETVRADSGGTLNGALLRAGLVNEVSVLIHPSLAGGAAPLTVFHEGVPADAAMSLRLASVERLAGDLVWLRYEVGK